MSDAVINEQPEVAVATTEATEVQPVEEATPAVATADESDKKTDVADDKKAENMSKTTTHSNHRDFKKNRKYDPTTQPVTDDPEKIRGQVCFAALLPGVKETIASFGSR